MRKLFAVVLFAVGCSSEAVESVAEQAQETVTNVSVVNQVTNATWAADKFCHPVYIGGSHAHDTARPMTWGIPATGGYVGQSRFNGGGTHSLTAMPDQSGWQPPPPGVIPTMAATYACNTYSDFHPNAGWWTGQTNTNDHVLAWDDPGLPTPQPASGSLSNLWDVNSACWVDGLRGVGDGSSYVDLTTFADPSVPPGQRWRLNVGGYKEIAGEARCAFLGKNLSVQGWYVATPGNPTVSLLSGNAGTCFIHKIFGNVDDGFALWDTGLFGWQLSVGGGVTRAEGYCVRY